MLPFSLYIVDDEETIRQGVVYGLKKDYTIQAFHTAEDALAALETDVPDLILLDINLPGMSGIEALTKIKADLPDVLVIMVTALEDIDTVITAMKAGAYDYIVKPLQMDALKATVTNALETIRMRKEIQTLQQKYLEENIPCFVAESDVIHGIIQFIDKVAKSPDTPVLIIGETGTGKELIASAVHYKSPNYRGPLVSLNCAAIPKDLVESELFGYEKGAFSGASPTGKKGLVEEAAGGTLFLDEVGDLSSEAQAKLLRFIEEGEYYRVGGSQKLTVRTRIVSATNKELEELVENGRFREDLYYRLAVINVRVPSLNERRDDIMPIAKHFLVEFSQKHKKQFRDFSTEAEQALLSYTWKGNIRELRNIIERGVLVGNGPSLTLQDVGLDAAGISPQPAVTETSAPCLPPIPDEGLDLTVVEEHYIKEAYKKAQGNEVKAAKLLKMPYYAFRYRKKKIKNFSPDT